MVYERIKDLCEDNNMTVSSLSQLLQFGKSTISRWRNDNTPNTSQLVKIADYFNVSIDYLLGRTDIKKFEEDDEDMLLIRRIKQNMSQEENKKMMSILKIMSGNNGDNLE